jgi:hypothetical protein
MMEALGAIKQPAATTGLYGCMGMRETWEGEGEGEGERGRRG